MAHSFKLFFRNDDLGWDLKKFDRMLEIFLRQNHKLNAAAIPTASQEAYANKDLASFEKQLQIHTHGFSHLDHETLGKKSEFAADRDQHSVARELTQGREMLQKLFPNLYFAGFTPPWNRMAPAFLPLLKESGYLMLSRDSTQSADIEGLAELNVDIDLHTRRDNVRLSATEIWEETLRTAKTKNTVGIMLHHKHMNDVDYEILEELLILLNQKQCYSFFMSELRTMNAN